MSETTPPIRPIIQEGGVAGDDRVTGAGSNTFATNWLVSGYDAYKLVSRDPRFSADYLHPNYPSVFPVRRRAPETGPKPLRTYSGMDPPEHAAHRRFVAPEFKAERVAELRPWVRGLVDDRLDLLFSGRQIADLVRDFAAPISADVILRLLGVPSDKSVDWVAYAHILAGDGADRAAVAAASAGFRRQLAEFIAEKGAVASADLTGRLLATYRREQGNSPEQVLEFVGSIFLAGFKSTTSMIALGAMTLMDVPDAARSVASDESGAAAAVVDELLRFHSVADRVTARVALEQVEIAGCKIQPGDGVVASTVGANRDPTEFVDPNTFDAGRDCRHHVAFGYGPHRCLGEHLAQMEIEVALTGLFRRFPNLTLAAGHPRPEIDESGIFRGLAAPLMVAAQRR